MYKKRIKQFRKKSLEEPMEKLRIKNIEHRLEQLMGSPTSLNSNKVIQRKLKQMDDKKHAQHTMETYLNVNKK